jgi:NTP pyrophosphatase (non-canonical NTP hydrolase)
MERYRESLTEIEQQIKKKQLMAQEAKEKGMHSTLKNLLAELSELKRKERKLHMGSR